MLGIFDQDVELQMGKEPKFIRDVFEHCIWP